MRLRRISGSKAFTPAPHLCTRLVLPTPSTFPFVCGLALPHARLAFAPALPSLAPAHRMRPFASLAASAARPPCAFRRSARRAVASAAACAAHPEGWVLSWPGVAAAFGRSGASCRTLHRPAAPSLGLWGAAWGFVRCGGRGEGICTYCRLVIYLSSAAVLLASCLPKGRRFITAMLHSINDFPTYPGSVFHLPEQRSAMLRQFWPLRYAARMWGCSYRAARLYLLRNPDLSALVRIQHRRGGVRWVLCAIAGTQKLRSFSGNPDFCDSEKQRMWALWRWRRRKARSL